MLKPNRIPPLDTLHSSEREILIAYEREHLWRERGEAAIREEMDRRLAARDWRNWAKKQPQPSPICLCHHQKTSHRGTPMRCHECRCVEFRPKVVHLRRGA